MSIIASTISNYMSLISVDAYGPISSNPTSRSPATYEENNDAKDAVSYIASFSFVDE